MTLPAVFWVGARIAGRRTSGRLDVDTGKLSLTLVPLGWRLERGPIVHTSGEVCILRARLIPPWFNTHVLVKSERGTASAAVPAWTRKEVIATLETAGFAVREERRWVAIGADADWH